eukprot:scaffold43911_cov20-Prasinocladus_malaysianus.AAC.1
MSRALGLIAAAGFSAPTASVIVELVPVLVLALASCSYIPYPFLDMHFYCLYELQYRTSSRKIDALARALREAGRAAPAFDERLGNRFRLIAFFIRFNEVY